MTSPPPPPPPNSAITFSPSILLKSDEISEGQYKITQLETPSTLPQVANDGDRVELNVDVGFLSIKGYIDPNTKEIGVEPKFMGIPGTNYYGSLTRGLGFDCELIVGRGQVNINLIWKDVILKASFQGRWGLGNKRVEQSILTLP